jgi:hypothetical protein
MGAAAGPLAGRLALAAEKAEGGKGVRIAEVDGKYRVEIDGALFTELHVRGAARPYLYPVIGPTGENMTRHWPMKEGANEQKDHPHHRSLWFTHGDVNGHDFWHGKRGEQIVPDRVEAMTSGPGTGVLRRRNRWELKGGKVVCTDTRTLRFHRRPDCRMIDFEVTLHASHGPVTMGDTKEGTMAIRVAPTMRLRGKVGRGHILNSEGVRDNATWGKRAAWCDYHGPLAGKTVGVAIFDHPGNPKHPTWWQVRDYGLFAANPFGVSYFERKPRGTGDVKIAAGKGLTFRYRFYFHAGDTARARVAEHYRTYAAEKASE